MPFVDDSDEHVPTGRRPVPNVEVKSHGGLVVVPPSPGRRLLPYTTTIAPLQPELLHALQASRAGHGGSNGYAGAAGGGDQLPSTDEFMQHGLGWFTGSRNRDAYRLAFRLWAWGLDEHDVAGVLKTCWDATTYQRASSWHEISRTALIVRRRRDDAWADELKMIEAFIGRSYE